jgi:dTDP-4-amino-4,6-dideoxygalactose transaminase
MRVPLLDLRAQYAAIKASVDAAVTRVIESQRFILGPEVDAFEQKVAAYSGCTHAVGVSSGTDAILAALMAVGVGPGDEVVTTPYTFVATCMSIARLGARAIFVDIEPSTCNLDIPRISEVVGPRTKAILPVHLYGQMVDVAAIRSLVGGVAVVEDAAQAIGAERDGRRAGSAGALGCLSFFPSKNLGCFGDGGMVITNDTALAQKVRLLRNQGQSPKHFSQVVGGNFRLDALQAAVLTSKLPYLDQWTSARQRNAALYRRLLGECGLVTSEGTLEEGADIAPLSEHHEGRHVYNQFVVRARRRDELRSFLSSRGIGTEVYYPRPMHLQTCFDAWRYAEGDFPESERAAAETVALPVYPELTPSMIEQVVGALTEFYKGPR